MSEEKPKTIYVIIHRDKWSIVSMRVLFVMFLVAGFWFPSLGGGVILQLLLAGLFILAIIKAVLRILLE